MTLEERSRKANEDLKELMKWFDDERKRIYNELNEKLGADRKFDGGNLPYKELHKEFAIRCKSVLDKYDLPLGTKLKLW